MTELPWNILVYFEMIGGDIAQLARDLYPNRKVVIVTTLKQLFVYEVVMMTTLGAAGNYEVVTSCDYFLITGYTWHWHDDNLKCNQWLQNSHDDYLSIPMNSL